MKQNSGNRIAVVGGGGHIGASLSLVFAEAGYEVLVVDKNVVVIEQLSRGRFPYLEKNAQKLLDQSPSVSFETSFNGVQRADVIVLAVGTPVNEKAQPELKQVYSALESCLPYMNSQQTLVLCSTVYLGATEQIQKFLSERGQQIKVAYCPERIAQGNSIEELKELPQIISASTDEALAVARKLFSSFNEQIIALDIREAELAKLFSNAYRYVNFAIANEFYMLSERQGLDFSKIQSAVTKNYSRAEGLAGAGLTEGPCLYKDTLQLAEINRAQSGLSRAAISVNQKMPEFLIDQALKLSDKDAPVIGLLGMAFKGNSDDSRNSLAYVMRDQLVESGIKVLCADPLIADESFLSAEELLEKASVLILTAPHDAFRELDLGNKPVVDCWGFFS